MRYYNDDYIYSDFDDAKFDREIRKERKEKSNGKGCFEATGVYDLDSIYATAQYTMGYDDYE